MIAAVFACLLGAAACGGAWEIRTAVAAADPSLAVPAADLAVRWERYRDDWLAEHGGAATVSSGPRGVGAGLEWDAAARLAPWAGAGVRLGWLAAPDHAAAVRGRGAWLETVEATETLVSSLSWAALGGWLALGSLGPADARFAFAAGPAWGSVTLHRALTTAAAGDESETTASASAAGLGWMTEAAAEAGWRLAPGLAASLRGGWRAARVPAMRFARHADLDGDGTEEVRRGARLEAAGGSALPFAFDGAFVSLGIRVRI